MDPKTHDICQERKALEQQQGLEEKQNPTEENLEKEVAAHSSILAWEIPWTEEPGRLQSTGSQRVGHSD